MGIRRIAPWLVCIVIFAAACKSLAQTPGFETTPSPTSSQAATNTVNVQLTEQAQSTAESLSATQTNAASQAAQETAVAQNRQSTATQRASNFQTATASVIAQATQQAQSMAEKIQKLLNEGVVASATGVYYRLADFDESWAKIDWYRWWPTRHTAEDFVITADTAWQSASDRANWQNSGCGFVFNLKDKDNHHLAFLGLDGFVRLERQLQGNYKLLALQKYGKVSIPKGEAKIMLVVYDKKISYYVNDQRVASAYDSSISVGNIALTLLSGTNKLYGTRCQMKNIELWIFK
jgi:hypothetical protein